MPRLCLLLVLVALTFTAGAQDRSGGNRPSDWIVKHYEPFGLWDSICDERMEEGVLKQRCYLRYVDVYAPRPNFGATFAFVFTEAGGTDVEFGFERGTRYAENGFRIERNDERVWVLSNSCLRRNRCLFKDHEAQSLLETFMGGGVLIQQFRDRHGRDWRLEWDLSRFDEALDDHRRASERRSLLN